ncbi:VOC family protein [Nocardia fusca]|uniref:VOC family protein n=1 Tax=Nocardia fusca TaxID=941183 RepID=UPI0037C7E754
MTMSKRPRGFSVEAGEQFPQLDHVGILVRDLEQASDQWQSRFGVPIASTFEAPSLDIRARFLILASAKIELYTIDEPNALDSALAGTSAKIDHIALRFGENLSEVDLTGCTIRGPGRPDPISTPFQVAGSDHVWTEPPGIDVLLQLITPSEATS